MNNPFSLEGRTVLVTGASSGIGLETARLASELGARVILVSRSDASLSAIAESLTGGPHLVRTLDLTEIESIPAWLKLVSKESGPIHGLVHCAGLHSMKPLRYLSVDEFEAVMRLNVAASLWLARGLRQGGVGDRPCSLVLMSSVVGLVGQAGVSVYSASKGAVTALTKSLALELVRDRIRVNCVAPGVVDTGMTTKLRGNLSTEQFDAITAMHPLGIGSPRDVANAIAFLLSDASRWITGTTLVVDGGYTAR